MASFCSAWRRSSVLFLLLCVLVAGISSCVSAKVIIMILDVTIFWVFFLFAFVLVVSGFNFLCWGL